MNPPDLTMAALAAAHPSSGPGVVALVGAGPGDPELITVKGLNWLRRADVVVYDRLVHPALVDQAPAGALSIYVGKRPGAHSSSQEEIHRLLVEHARAGRVVVRLKGGDPFVFGRGGEEVLALGEAGVACVVVPGITSAVAVPGWAGVPVTHRNVAASFGVVTAHRACDGAEPDWPALARLDTLVVLMGVAGLDDVAGRLMDAGRPAATPVALVERGTLDDGRVLVTTLAEAGVCAAQNHLRSPAAIVVGEVVALQPQIAAALTDPHRQPLSAVHPGDPA